MKIGEFDIVWWPIILRYTSTLYTEVDKTDVAWYWKLVISLIVLILWIVGVVVISVACLILDMVVSTFSSWNAIKASFYWVVMVLLFLVMFPHINVDYLYSKIRGESYGPYSPTACLEEFDITRYATAPKHEASIVGHLEKMGFMDSPEKIQAYIDENSLEKCFVTGEMVWRSANKHSVDARLMLAIMHQDSHFGTARNKDGSPSKAMRTKNPGNVGNDDPGRLFNFKTWDEGVDAVAKWLKKNRRIVT